MRAFGGLNLQIGLGLEVWGFGRSIFGIGGIGIRALLDDFKIGV